MWPPRPIFERIPQVWFLLGLLFVATGLYLGFDYSMSFLYIMVGAFCCAFGVAVFVLRLREPSKVQAAAGPRKDIEFDSAEPRHLEPAPAMSEISQAPVAEKSGND